MHIHFIHSFDATEIAPQLIDKLGLATVRIPINVSNSKRDYLRIKRIVNQKVQ